MSWLTQRVLGRRPAWLRTLAAGAIGILIGVGAAPAYHALATDLPAIQTVHVSTSEQAQGSPAVGVFQKLAPSVVLVTNQAQINSYNGPQSQTAWGSGVIFNPDGYIVTNDHVVAGAQKVTVTLGDGSSYPAQVIGGDASTDLAVIRISVNHPLPAATFANSDDVSPGELAIAIGNPLGQQFTQSVTQGIVGAIRPMLYGLDGSTPRVTQMIQTDTPINPGNSGGALANVQGEVIGITTMKVPSTGDPNVPATGLGFAIPSNTVSRVVSQLIQNGYVKRAWLGVAISPTPADALPSQPQALTIASLVANGPAASAGLRQGDVIVSWNGQPLTNYFSLVEATNTGQPGDTVSLGIKRGGQALSVRVTLGEEPRTQEQPTSALQPSPGRGGWTFPFPFPNGR